MTIPDATAGHGHGDEPPERPAETPPDRAGSLRVAPGQEPDHRADAGDPGRKERVGGNAEDQPEVVQHGPTREREHGPVHDDVDGRVDRVHAAAGPRRRLIVDRSGDHYDGQIVLLRRK
jgi:hypothetical protein